MTGSAIRVEGLSDFRPELRQVDPNAAKELRKAYSKIASHTQSRARTNATLAGGAYAAAKTSIRGSASNDGAYVGLNRRSHHQFAGGTFFGALGRFGWYAQAKYAASAGRQFPEWVGSNWRAGVTGEGPYVINYTVDEERPEIYEMFGDAMDDLFGPSFPN